MIILAAIAALTMGLFMLACADVGDGSRNCNGYWYDVMQSPMTFVCGVVLIVMAATMIIRGVA